MHKKETYILVAVVIAVAVVVYLYNQQQNTNAAPQAVNGSGGGLTGFSGAIEDYTSGVGAGLLGGIFPPLGL